MSFSIYTNLSSLLSLSVDVHLQPYTYLDSGWLAFQFKLVSNLFTASSYFPCTTCIRPTWKLNKALASSQARASMYLRKAWPSGDSSSTAFCAAAPSCKHKQWTWKLHQGSDL